MAKKNQLGIDMLYLGSDDRANLMKGTLLRRLPDGTALSKEQFETAIECDMATLKEKWSGFDHKDYIGMDIPALYNNMLIGQLINERNHASEDVPIVERGSYADTFLTGLSDNLQEMIEYMPMSTRGFLDNLRVRPQGGKVINLTPEQFDEIHKGGDKKVLVDDSELNPMRRRRDSVVDGTGNGLVMP
jgi:hypothetical protein